MGISRALGHLWYPLGRAGAEAGSEEGFYAQHREGGVRWVVMRLIIGQSETEAAAKAALAAGEIAPIFCYSNVGELRRWPGILYPHVQEYATDFIGLCALLTDVHQAIWRAQHGTHAPVAPLTDAELAGAARNFLYLLAPRHSDAQRSAACLAEIGVGSIGAPAVIDLIREIASTKALVPSAWSERRIYRRTGLTTRAYGAEIALDDVKTLEGISAIDYQDVFAALAEVADYLRCPAPPMILNRTGELRMERNDPDKMDGWVMGLKVEVQDTLVCSQPSLDVDRLSDAGDASEGIEAIIKALAAHGVILPAPGARPGDPPTYPAVRREWVSTLYFESQLPIDFPVVYLAGILFPRTIMRRFFINELTNHAVSRQKNVLYYTCNTPEGGPLVQTHVYLRELGPKEGRPSLPIGLRPHVYAVTFVHKHPSHLRQFEADFSELLGAVAANHQYISALHHLLDKEGTITQVSPPEMAANTRLHTVKSHGRAAGDANRPVCVPAGYGISGAYPSGLGLHLAFALSYIITSAHSNVYTLGPNGRFVPVTEPTAASSYYLSPNQQYPVVWNKAGEGTGSILPWVGPRTVPAIDREIEIPVLPEDRELRWFALPIEYSRSDGTSFYDALRDVLPPGAPATLAALARSPPYSEGRAAALCRPELFDHTPEEAAATFESPNSALHFRLLEEAAGAHIFVFAQQERPPHGQIHTKTVPVALEIHRHSGAPLRDFGSYTRGIVLYKYYYLGWRYIPVVHSTTAFGATAQVYIGPELIGRLALRYYAATAPFDYTRGISAGRTIDRKVAGVLKGLGAALLHQTFNADGGVIALTIRCPTEALEKHFRARPGAFLSGDLTLIFIEPVLPFVCPAGDSHAELACSDPPHFTNRGAMLYENALFLVQQGPVGGRPPAGPPPYIYQRPIIVLMSLVKWAILWWLFKSPEGRTPAGRRTAIMGALSALIIPQGEPREGPRVLVTHRFPPPPPVAEFTFGELIGWAVNIYLRGLPLSIITRERLGEWAVEEAETAVACRIGPGAVRYIDGIHDFVPRVTYAPSPETLALYRPASAGRAAIVTDWAGYHYARTRYASREALSSWWPIPDMTGTATATDLVSLPSFMMRIAGGAVVYGFLLAGTVESNRDRVPAAASQLARPGEYEPVPMRAEIMGAAALFSYNFTQDSIALFNTSANNNQGSLYLLRAYVFH